MTHPISLRFVSFYVILFILTFSLFGQTNVQLDEFNSARLTKNKQLMLTLGGWSVVNISTGIAGSLHTSGTAQHFHQMNALWNTVNLTLSVGGLLRYKKDTSKSFNLTESIYLQRKTERIFLINSFVDLGYIGAGSFLNYRSMAGGANAELQKGFGNSLIVQGAFLLLFDTAAYFIHKKNRLKQLEPIVNSKGL